MNGINVNDLSKLLIISPSTEVPTQYSCSSLAAAAEPSTSKNVMKKIDNYEDDSSNIHWTKEHSLILIDCYKIYRNKVGGMQIRNLKKMWEIIAEHIMEKFKLKYTAGNCENRWRVLERNYKKYIDNNNKTGRGRKYFEFSDEMDAIFSKKRNIHPEILLSASTTIKPNANKENSELSVEVDSKLTANQDLTESQLKTMPNAETPKKRKRLQSAKYTKDVIIEQIRLDRKHYQDERLKLEKYKVEKMLEIETEKLEIKRRRNQLLEVKNGLLEIIANTKNNYESLL